MNKALDKLIEGKKKKGEIGDTEKRAKMGVLDDLQGLASSAMFKSASKKAAPAEDALMHSKDADGGAHEAAAEMAPEGSPEHEATESPEEEMAEDEESQQKYDVMAPEELDKHIKMMLKAKLAKQHAKYE